MTVSKNEIERIANLASVVADDSNMDQLVRDIESIVDFVGQLNAVDASANLPMYRPGPAEAPLRADVVDPIPLSLAVEDFAPRSRDGFFLVPRVDGVGESE